MIPRALRWVLSLPYRPSLEEREFLQEERRRRAREDALLSSDECTSVSTDRRSGLIISCSCGSHVGWTRNDWSVNVATLRFEKEKRARSPHKEQPADSSLVMMPLTDLLAFWRPGSHDWTWADEYRDLIGKPSIDELRYRVVTEGFGFHDSVAPVMLGNDGRVWDGHHRICLAIQHHAASLMVEIAPPSAVEPVDDEACDMYPDRGAVDGTGLRETAEDRFARLRLEVIESLQRWLSDAAATEAFDNGLDPILRKATQDNRKAAQ